MPGNNEIDILITKFFSGEALPEEAMELEDWVSMSPENESHFNNCSKIFAMTVDITHNDRTRIWGNINDAFNKEKNKWNAKVINWRLKLVAASIIFIFTIGLLIDNYQKETTVVYKAETSSRKVLLKDKSEIIISANSSITIDKEYGISNRKIKLNGSASFSVVHNPSQAFIIDMKRLHIKDIGTAFSVVTSSAGDTIFINITEGEISVYDDFGSSINMVAGEKVIYIQSQKKLQLVHLRDDPILTTTRHGKTKMEIKNADSAKDKNSGEASADTSVKNYPYSSYPSPYPLDEDYTTEGKRALTYKDSIETRRITDDMLIDKLITTEMDLSFRLSNAEFIINGKLQSNAIFQRYRKKYIPASKQGAEWVWSHNMGKQDLDHK